MEKSFSYFENRTPIVAVTPAATAKDKIAFISVNQSSNTHIPALKGTSLSTDLSLIKHLYNL